MKKFKFIKDAYYNKFNRVYCEERDAFMREAESSFSTITPYGYECLQTEAHRVGVEAVEILHDKVISQLKEMLGRA